MSFVTKVEELHASGELADILKKPLTGPTHTSVPYALALSDFVAAKNVCSFPDIIYPGMIRHASDMFRHAVAKIVDKM